MRGYRFTWVLPTVVLACSVDPQGSPPPGASADGGALARDAAAPGEDGGPRGADGGPGTSDAGLGTDVIPANRRIDWRNAGVPGGIPARPTVCATIDAATLGKGTVDASVAINRAVAACPEGQTVSLPAGTYRLDHTITFGARRDVTLRGAGPVTTILRPADSLGAAITTGQTGLSAPHAVTGGATKGSRTITVDDTTGVAPGMVIDLFQDDDPDFYWTRGLTQHTGQFSMVTQVSGKTLTLEDPLVWTFDKRPRVRYPLGDAVSRVGIEDLGIVGGRAYGGSMIQLWNAYASWIKNVETAWGNGNEHIYVFGCLRCEIRDSTIHDTYSTTDGYGIVTGSGYGGPRGGTTGLLIENNVFSGLWGATVLETEVGSVVAYNYTRNMRFPGWPDYQIADYNGNHGPHGMMVLYEGNVGSGGILQDGYHGSVSHATYFRNAFSGKHAQANRTGNIKLIDLARFSYYHNVVGNVLGDPDWPRATIGKYEMVGSPDYTAQAVIYRLGYPNMGNNGYSATNPPSDPDDGGLDPKVAATLLRWGNFDYQSRAARFEASEVPAGVPVPSHHALPPSLFRDAKPSYWGDLAWPAVGPDRDPMVGKIPAQLRGEKMAL